MTRIARSISLRFLVLAFPLLPALSGCWWNSREVAAPQISVKEEKQPVKCCVCDVAFSTDPQVDDYFGKTNCENRSDHTPFKTCRKVTIEESSCNRVIRDRSGGCVLNPLHFTEKGVRITLEPAKDSDFNCRHIAEERDEVKEKMEQMDNVREDSEAAEPDNYCTCEIDPTNDANCRVILIQSGNITVLDTAPRKPNQGCARDECMQVFNQENFRNNCPTYQDMPQ